MSDYTKTTDFDVKDSLPSGDTGKIIRGSEFEVEFENIEVAIASKADSLNTVLTGNTSATNLSVTGNTTLGNAATDTVTVNADFSSDLLPSADATYDLGAVGSEWQDLYITGTANIDSLVADTVAISGGTVTATLTGNVTGDLTGTVLTAAQPNITSLGTLTSASISGDLAVDTNTLFVDASENKVGIGNASPTSALTVEDEAAILSVSSGGSSTLIIGSGQNSQDSVQGIQFKDRFGTTGFPNGQIGAYVQMERQSTNARYDLTFGTISSSTEDAAERMRITDTGNVGIGTSSPASLVASGSSPILSIGGTDSGLTTGEKAGSLSFITNDTSYTATYADGITGEIVSVAETAVGGGYGLAFYTGVTTDTDRAERVRIDMRGNVGIGITTPASLLHVDGDFRAGTASTYASGVVHVEQIIAFPNNTNSSADAWNNEDKSHVKITSNNNSMAFGVSNVENSRLGWIQTGHASPAFATATTTSTLALNPFGGTVGIGTTSPTEKLHVNGDALIGNAGPDANLYLFKRFDGTGALKFQRNTAGLPIDASVSCDPFENLVFDWNIDVANSNCIFKSNSDEKMRIDASGNLLVGTQAANTSSAGHILYPTGENYLLADGTSSNQQVRFYRNVDATAALVGSIATTGTATTYNTSSDVRLKENITDAPEGNVDALQVRSFDWKVDGSHQEYGFIAQELEAVAPYAVTKGETEDDMWGVDYSKLVPMLVKEIQDLKARIATLEAN